MVVNPLTFTQAIFGAFQNPDEAEYDRIIEKRKQELVYWKSVLKMTDDEVRRAYDRSFLAVLGFVPFASYENREYYEQHIREFRIKPLEVSLPTLEKIRETYRIEKAEKIAVEEKQRAVAARKLEEERLAMQPGLFRVGSPFLEDEQNTLIQSAGLWVIIGTLTVLFSD